MKDDKTPLLASAPIRIPENLDAALALIESQFVPYFQPLVILRTGQLAGFEVLARWQHPILGLILPAQFIPSAEQDGWIGELTRQVLQKAFLTAAAAIPDPLTLAVNFSPLQLWDTNLPRQLRALAEEANFPLARIVIEITESALIENLQSASAIVAELKQMGCRLSLDDFGTGFSSLSHLQALPFDKLKVDRSFVCSMTEKRESRKIVSAVVGLGQSLGLKTIAEGIETQEQAEMMLWLGCDCGQGYFYGRPLPAEELSASVSANREKLLIHPGSAGKKLSSANLDSSPTQRLAQLQAVFDGAPVGLAFLDRNMCYINLNQRLADMNRARIEDHLGNHVSEMIPEIFPHIEQAIQRALSGEPVNDIEVQLSSTGETRLLSYQPVQDEAGEVIGVSVAATDITDRKRTEEALKRSEAHYKSMVDTDARVVWMMDAQGHMIDLFTERGKETGLMRPPPKSYDWLKSVHPADIQPTVRAITKSRRTGSGIDVRYRVADANGSWLWKRSRGAPRFDETGKIVCWYGSVEDSQEPTQSNETADLAGAKSA